MKSKAQKVQAAWVNNKIDIERLRCLTIAYANLIDYWPDDSVVWKIMREIDPARTQKLWDQKMTLDRLLMEQYKRDIARDKAVK